MESPHSLTSDQAAARLGITPASLYAYVSRGLVSRERTPHGSRFDPLEVEAFAARRSRRHPVDTVRAAGTPLMVLDTDVAVVLDDELFLRGRNAVRLAADETLEDVARFVWDMADPWPQPDAADAQAVRRAVDALPASATTLDRFRTAVTVLAATDPLRREAAADRIAPAAARILAHVPGALGAPGADSLWTALSARDATSADRRALDAALILLVDHDLAVSTMAARMAASARGSAYAILSAALGAFDTPLHGTASTAARELLQEVAAGTDATTAVSGVVARTGAVPGFGHPLYSGTDARAAALLPLVYRMPGGDRLSEPVARLAEVMRRRAGRFPNVDLALAALTIAGDMPPGAGTAIFAVGRSVGWIAHGIAEHSQPAMRLRPRGRYVGPTP